MKTAPLVSIVTPAYNASEFLPQTVASVLAQTWRDFELLIVDDGSTDSTLQIAHECAEADSRIRVLTRKHGGPSAARNTAMSQARGRYFALIDSDDLWDPTFLEVQMGVFRSRRRVDVVTGNALNLGGRFDGRPLKPRGPVCKEISLLDILERENSVFIMSVFRRRVFERIGGFDETLPHNEDYEFWVRAAHAGFVFVHNPVPLAHYRRRPDSISANEMRMVTGAIGVLSKARDLCADRPRELAAIDRQLARFENRRAFAAAKASLLRHDFETAAHEFAMLSRLSRDFVSGVIATIGRRVPAVLLWAYKTKAALRQRRRSLDQG